MTSNLSFDPEFWEIYKPLSGFKKPIIEDPIKFREFHESILKERLGKVPRVPGIAETKHEIASLDGTKITVHRFVPQTQQSATTPQRAVVYLHGGGMILGSVDVFRPLIEAYAAQSDVQVFAVAYRRAPEHPAPAAVEDALAAVQWLQAGAAGFGVDPARIALFGNSAGGGLAAGAALMARDRGLSPPLARLILNYPMLDDRTALPADHPLHEFLFWTQRENDMGWKAYLGGREKGQRDDVSIYAAPGRADSLEGLPPTYICIGGLDLFKQENLEFAAKLAKANNDVEFHLFPGVPHGWEGMAPLISVSKEAAESRRRALSRF